MSSSASAIGRAGEFLASYILETFGVEVHHVSRDGADLWCKIHDSRIVAISVKTASTASNGKKTGHTYRFFTPNTVPVDYFGFVALDRQILLIRPFEEKMPRTTTIPARSFNEGNQRRTIEEMIAAC